MSKGSKWWIVLVVSAFASVISFFQVNSAFADEHDFNGGFIILGIVLGLIAVYALLKAKQNSN